MAAAQAGISLPGLMVVAGWYEDELPCLRGDGDDVAEIASLEKVERLSGEHLVELGITDTRRALRVIVPFRLDILPTHGARGNDGDVKPDVLLAKVRTIPGSEGEVAVHEVQGHIAGLVRVGEHAPHVVEGPDGGFGEGPGPVTVHRSIFCCCR